MSLTADIPPHRSLPTDLSFQVAGLEILVYRPRRNLYAKKASPRFMFAKFLIEQVNQILIPCVPQKSSMEILLPIPDNRASTKVGFFLHST